MAIIRFILAFIVCTSVSHAEILFYDDAEAWPPPGRYALVGIPSDGQGEDSITVSTEQKRSGNASYKFYLGPLGQTPGLPWNYDAHAMFNIAEAITSDGRNFLFDTEYWIGFSAFIPSPGYTALNPSYWNISTQFHGSPDDCETWRNPNIAFQGKRDGTIGWDMIVRSQSVKCGVKIYDSYDVFNSQSNPSFGPVPSNVWVDYVYHFKWTHTSEQGFFKVYVNGDLQVHDTGDNCFNDDHAPYFSVGLYSDDPTTERTIFLDEIRIGGPNSNYAEVAPRDAGPDTDPPLRSGGLPTGELASGTTSTTMTLSTNEDATCKYGSVAGQSYAAMTNTFTTTGGKSHSQLISGLSDGNTYPQYIRCTDGTNANSDDYVITISVDDGAGGQANLLASAIYVVGSDVNTYTDCYAAQYLTDGDTTAPGCYSTTGIEGVTSINREYDLLVRHNLTDANLFGDAFRSWQCLTWSLLHKENIGDSWTPAFTGANCNFNDWDNRSLSAIIARYVRFEITGPAAGTQVRDMALHGTPVEASAGGRARGTFSAGGARGTYSASGMTVP